MTAVVAEFSVTPVTDQALTPFIDTAVQEIERSGLKHQVGPVGTTVEGELDTVLDAIKHAHQAVLSSGADRVVTEIRIDDRKGGLSMDEEIEAFR